MKLIVVLFLMLSARLVAAEFPAEKMVGQWRYTSKKDNIVCNITYSKDGKFFGEVIRNDKKSFVYKGKWKLDGKKLLYTYTYSSKPWIKAGTLDQDEIIEFDAKYYLIKAANGRHRKYVRIE